MRLTILLLTLTCILPLRNFAVEFKTAGDWSEPTNGLRGRLLFAEGAKSKTGTRTGFIYLEIQNVPPGDTLHVYYDVGKEPLRCELRDTNGKLIQNSPSGSDWRPAPCWLALPVDSTLRFRTGSSSYGSSGSLDLIATFVSGTWFLPAGATNDYYLSGTFSVAIPAGESRPRAWEGTLKLLPVRIPMKAQ